MSHEGQAFSGAIAVFHHRSFTHEKVSGDLLDSLAFTPMSLNTSCPIILLQETKIRRLPKPL
jgi:hypothetical protein